MIVKPCQQDIQSDLVRGLLPFSAFNQRNHAINKRLSRVRGDAHFDLIGKYAACHP